MKIHTLFFIACSSLLFTSLIPPSHADSYDLGMDAYQNNDYDQARSIWKALAEQGHPQAAYNLGFMYEFGYGIAPRDDEAFAWYLLAALHNHTLAQHTVAWMYQRGKGVKQDLAQAQKWTTLLANAVELEITPHEEVIQVRIYLDQLQSELERAARRYDVQKAAGPQRVFQLEASNATS